MFSPGRHYIEVKMRTILLYFTILRSQAIHTLSYFGLFILFNCSAIINDERIEGHWHCMKPGQCLFETIDIKDSILMSDRYIMDSYIRELYLDKNRSEYDKDVEVKLSNGILVLYYADTTTQYSRSDLKTCLLSDRYSNCMINLSLPEVQSAWRFDDPIPTCSTGNLFIGKLAQGLDNSNDKLAKQYPDSIFIQVNDIFIQYNDISKYVRELKSCLHGPRPSINLHVDKDIPEGVVATVVKLINPGEYSSIKIFDVVKIKNGDIGLIKR